MPDSDGERIDYDSMVRILRAFARRPPNYGGLDVRSLAAHAGITEHDVRAALPALEERAYVTHSGGGYLMPERVREVAACNPDQLLARDIAAWVRDQSGESFLVRDLPAALRRDWPLLVLAVEDLIKTQALAPRFGGPTSDLTELVIQPRLRTYAFGAGAQSFATQIQQVFGDHVAGDKNVIGGSGAIVTGDANSVTVDADAVGNFRVFLDVLREQAAVHASVVAALHRAARDDVGPNEAKGIVEDAIAKDPRLVPRLKSWAATLPGHLARAAIVETIKLVLKSQGVL